MRLNFGYQTLEMKIESRILSQCNKLLIDYSQSPGNTLSDADHRHDESMFTSVFPNADAEYPLSDREMVDLEHSRLIEVIRYEQIQIFNLEEMMGSFDIPDYSVPLLYVAPAMGMAPVNYPNLPQNCRAYEYPVSLRLILNRDQTAFPDLTTTDTESLIREGIKYVLDRSKFLNMEGHRSGYEIPSRVIDNTGITRATLEGFQSPTEVFDYEFSLILQEQATLSANPFN